ncbi:MAG: hypothetical protein ACREAE_05040, partial [Nitrosopumilaceae archaeon]
MSVQISYKKQFILGIIFLLVVIVTIEIIARTYEYYNPPCEFVGRDAFKNIHYSLQRQICLDSVSLSSELQTIPRYVPDQHYSTININSHGFRGHEITKEKPENTYRIFVVGGSTIFGYGSTSDDTTI